MLIRYALALLLVSGLGGCEMFSSVKDLTEIFSLEKRVMDALNHYVRKTEDKLDSIKRHLREYEHVRAEGATSFPSQDLATVAEEDSWSEMLAGSPIQAYHLIKRLSRNWKSLQSYDPKKDWKCVEESLVSGELFGLSELWKEEDLQIAAQALIRLQSVYKLNTSSLARGNVWGIQSSAELTAQDCLYLGKNSFNNGMYSNAIDWFEQAYILAGQERNETVSQGQAMRFLEAAIEAFDSSQRKAHDKERAPSTFVNPYSSQGASQAEVSKKRFREGKHLTEVDDYENFQTLCRGEQLLSPAYMATLYCYFDSRRSPYLTLMPGKVEELFHDPPVLLFHDIISEKEITRLIQMSKPRLERAAVLHTGGAEESVSNLRTSRVMWVDKYEEQRIFWRLNLRIQCLTGLSSDPLDSSAEQFQVANYGIGGHYSPHRDYLMGDKTERELKDVSEEEQILGDRIATWMFYLSDVLQGGATAFPKLGVSIFPRKGSAAFWYNLKRSGRGDVESLHGACPVVHGTKWVTNKWIREYNQFLRRPCGLSEDA